MPRDPFDPSRAPGSLFGDTPGARREKRRYGHAGEVAEVSVTQACDLIRKALEDRVPAPLRVVGEISNFNGRNHWYFSLKDEEAVLSCVTWASTARRLAYTPANGDKVVATGHVSHYGPQGRTQLYVDRIEPVGAGELERRYRELCERLRGEGYFDEARKKPLPLLPRRVVVVTSRTGAALQDVLSTAAQRCPAVGLLVVDVRVQGDGAAESVARAIRAIDARAANLEVDAMLVTRGGGSIEDLWAFNEPIVAEAVFASTTPIIAAIGHESDTTIIELVADVRASTPTQAAMRLIPSADELNQQVAHHRHRLDALLRRDLERRRARLEGMERHPLLRDPAGLIVRASDRLADRCRGLRRVMRSHLVTQRARLGRLTSEFAHAGGAGASRNARDRVLLATDRLRHAMAARLDERGELAGRRDRLAVAMASSMRHRRERAASLRRQLELVGPQRVLERGYTLTRDADGKLVRTVADVGPGATLHTLVADGAIESVVRGNAPQRRRRPPREGEDPGRDQLDLFGGAK